MLTKNDFKELAMKRLKTAEFLMQAGEWGMAAYILGFVLECILKAAACNALNLTVYPEVGNTKERRVLDYFRTHDFDMLLVVSGTSDLFGLTGQGSSSWSGFTQEYTGNWTSIRYEILNQFNEKKVERLYKYIIEEPSGIIPLIESQKRW